MGLTVVALSLSGRLRSGWRVSPVPPPGDPYAFNNMRNVGFPEVLIQRVCFPLDFWQVCRASGSDLGWRCAFVFMEGRGPVRLTPAGWPGAVRLYEGH